MRYEWQEKAQTYLLNRVPLLMTLILMLLFFVPLNSLELSQFRPMISVICVFYWVLKKGQVFGYISAFWVGFFADAYSSTPLGVNIMLLMLLTMLVKWLARYLRNASLSGSWLVIGLVALGFITVKWLFLMIYSGRYLSFGELFFSFVSTVLFYPLVAYLNVRVQRRFLPEKIDEQF